MIEFYELIGKITVALSTILALILIVNYRKLPYILKVVGIYIIVGAAIDIVATSLYYIQESNLVFLHLFTLFEIVILSHLFHVIFKRLKSKTNVYYIAIPATLLIILNTIFIQNIDMFNSYSSMLTSVIIIGFSIHFYLLSLEFHTPNFQFITLKWFVNCLFIYHSISLIVMLFGSVFHNISQESQSYIWIFRSTIILITKIILISCFLKLFLNNKNLKTP